MRFAQAVQNQEARTENGMKALKSTSDAVVDLFYKVGASRGQDITPTFAAAYVEDRTLALRIALWARDIRGGAGERQTYRNILAWLEKNNKDDAALLLNKTPEVGRWDDVLQFTENDLKLLAFNKIKEALEAKNGLAAKWMPRKGPLAAELRNFLGWSPKRYRKTLVGLTNVVETQMCAKEWDKINFSHVPSIAAKRYRKAFYKNANEAYTAYVNALVKGEKLDGKDVKINASAIFPHDVIREYVQSHLWDRRQNKDGKTVLDVMVAQWDALPNFMTEGVSILPVVDVSGSMTWCSVDKSGLQPLSVAIGLGLYCADKAKGPFKDVFCTFSSSPELTVLKGNIMQKIDQMSSSNVGGSTDLHKTFNLILNTAVKNNVPQEEMPGMVLILSDMQFNHCVTHDDSAIEMIARKYEQAGYKLPQVVFWNINSKSNVPVEADKSGAALVSGFSPSVLKALLSADMDQFTPRGIMLKTIMVPRYDI